MKILYDFSLVSIFISLALLGVFIVFLVLAKRRKEKKLKQKIIEELDYNKNILDTYPIENELVKVETLIKNEKLEEQYKTWQERFQKIKDENVVNLNEIVLKLDSQNVENFDELKEDAKRELYKAKFLLSALLEEIEDVNMSEEKYRTLIIKLKTKYRELKDYYEKNEKENIYL